jgi:hypothetical protein
VPDDYVPNQSVWVALPWPSDNVPATVVAKLDDDLYSVQIAGAESPSTVPSSALSPLGETPDQE